MKNPLFLLPPEMAHTVTIAALKMGLGPRASVSPEKPVTLFGKIFKNPIGLSAGADKEGAALSGWDKMGFGFVEVGTVMPRPRHGNPLPRIWRFTDQNAVVNWMGLPSSGPDNAYENIHRYKTQYSNGIQIGVSIASVEGYLDDFAMLAHRFASVADYLTLNASCPNTEEKDTGLIDNMASQIKAVVGAAGKCPVLVKLGPTNDASVLAAMVDAAMNVGVAGFVATNTVPPDKRELLADPSLKWPQCDGNDVGGYSGPMLLDISTGMVSEIRRIAGPDVPIIGVGGIQSGQDARFMLDAGANAIQLYTGLIYKGPKLISDILRAL